MTAGCDRSSGAREIAPGVIVLTSPAYALNSGIVTGLSAAALIDPGYFPSDLDRIATYLDERGLEASHVVLTHSDWDHVVGPSRFPRARIVASSRYPERTASEAGRIERSLSEFDRKLYVRRDPPAFIPRPDSLVGAPSDLVWEGPRTKLLPAGGHTPDGLMALVHDCRVLFAGDYLSDCEIPFVGESVASYLATLGSIRSLLSRGEIEQLVPGHGDLCGREGIEERLEEDEDYLRRLQAWVGETRRSVETLEGVLERADEVVFRKGWENPDVRAEHRANVARVFTG